MNKKEQIALQILMSDDSESEKVKKIERMDFSVSNMKSLIKKLEAKVSKLDKVKSNLAEEAILELAAELGTKNNKPVVRYFIPPNPKPFKFEELGPEQQKSAKKFAEQHNGIFKGLGKGEYNTENGFDLTLKSNGVWKIKSKSANIDKQVGTK